MISVIITFRGTDSYRIENLYAVQAHLQQSFPSWEIIIIEQDKKSSLDLDRFLSAPRHLLVQNPGAFNKSWGINVGYRLSTEETLLITDADMLVSKQDLKRSTEAIHQGLDVVRPFRRLIDMTKQETSTYLESGTLPERPEADRGFDRNYLGERICLAGGLFFIKRTFFETIGGFDERFSGWGGEDDAFSIKAEAMTSRSAIARHAFAWHLWHPRTIPQDHSDYHDNTRLLSEYQHLDNAGIGKLIERVSEMKGLINKFEN
ncbi:MAG: galactosyltransferase-related protein [Arenicellales bacterium]